MAHECPECGFTCHCGGDIDDCCFERNEYCSHCDHDDDYAEDEDYWECEFCSADPRENHAIGCPNNHSPFNDLITKGYD